MNEEKKTFSCVLCGKKLDSKEALQEHFRKHANKEIDAKGNPIKYAINKNKPSETEDTSKTEDNTDDGKIICDVCSMEFESITTAIQHKFRRHPESSAKHFCPFCGMQFPLKFTRDKHVQTHKNMSTYGSFPCSECGVVFHNTQAQSYHFKSTHKRIMSIFKPVPTPPPSKKIKINNANEAQSVYYCYLCGMEYIIKFNLQKHLERAHNEEEREKVPDDLIKCTTCDALFYNKKAYDNHNMYHKPDDLYVTSEEQRLQTVTRVDQDFDIRRVQPVTDKFIPLNKPKQRRPNAAKKAQQLNKKDNLKLTTDDELSPTSSIDSSDSESETKNKVASKTSTENTSTNETDSNKTELTVQKLAAKEIPKQQIISINKPKEPTDNKLINTETDKKNEQPKVVVQKIANISSNKDNELPKTVLRAQEGTSKQTTKVVELLNAGGVKRNLQPKVIVEKLDSKVSEMIVQRIEETPVKNKRPRKTKAKLTSPEIGPKRTLRSNTKAPQS